jgi:hypothetical protein
MKNLYGYMFISSNVGKKMKTNLLSTQQTNLSKCLISNQVGIK